MLPSLQPLRISAMLGLLLLLAAGAIASPRFTNATAAMGLDIVHASGAVYGPGVSAVDYDLDGDLDLFVCDDTIGNRLYQNNGGELVNVAPALGLDWRPDAETTPGLPATEDVGSMMPHFVDLENDGDRDLFLTVWNRPDRFWRNNGDGTFTDRSDSSGILPLNGSSATASFGDYNRDGLLDVYVADWGELDTLYRSTPAGFTSVGERTGLFDVTVPVRPGWGGVWFYFDNADRYPELYVANDFSFANFCYWNLANGSFLEYTDVWFADTENGGASMGIAFGDYDRDGDEDIFVTNARNQVNDFYRRRPNRYENIMYTADPSIRPLKDINIGWFVDWLDVDNDGWLDLYVVNGYIPTCPPDVPQFPHACPIGERNQPNRMWLNTGSEFVDVSESSGLDDPKFGRGAAVSDFDLDGDLDIFFTNNNGRHAYMRNDTPDTGNWLTIRLTGRGTNRDGIGVLIRAKVGDVTYRRTHFGSTGYLSQPSDEVYFGLGDATSIDELQLVWMRGVTDVLYDVPVNLRLGLTEGVGETYTVLPSPPTLSVASTSGGPQLSVSIPEGAGYGEMLVHRARAGNWSGVIARVPVQEGENQWVDASAVTGELYRYRVVAVAEQFEMSSDAAEIVAERTASPARAPVLGAGFPNPFNPKLTLPILLPEGGSRHVELVIYDVAGRRVRTLFSGQRSGGEWNAEFDGTDDSGVELPSGIYYARLEVGGFDDQSQKLTLIR